MSRWLQLTFLALISWGVWAVMARLIGDALDGAQNQALSTLGILPVMIAIGFLKKSAVAGNLRRGIGYAFASGVISSLGNVVYYDALSRGGQAALIVPLTALYPLTTILLALVILRERLNRLQWAGAFVSLAAIYLFNVQREEGFLSHWLLLALLPIALWGASGFLQKLSTNHVSGELATLWFLAAFIPFGGLCLLQSPLPAHVSGKIWSLVIAQGFFLALGNLAVLAAFAQRGKASIVTPLAALYPAVSVPIAIGFLGEKVAPREAVGILLALISVVLLSRETPASAPTPPASTPATQPLR
jgi:transporter family protein